MLVYDKNNLSISLHGQYMNYKVTSVLNGKKQTKTFKGESSHTNAERYIYDMLVSVRDFNTPYIFVD